MRTLAVAACIAVICGVGTSASMANGPKVCPDISVGTFINTLTVHRPDGTYSYQFRLVLVANNSVTVKTSLTGDAGPFGNEEALGPGNNNFTYWLNVEDKLSPGKTESLTVKQDCATKPKPTVTVKLWTLDQARGLVQPWNIGCPEMVVIDSRGSGAKPGTISPPGQKFAQGLALYNLARFTETGPAILPIANPYPATGGFMNMLMAVLSSQISAKLKLRLLVPYNLSVSVGEKWLRQELADVAQKCGHTQVYLTGYSQGAQVTGNVYQGGTYSNVDGVALFGDPLLNPLDSSDEQSEINAQAGSLGLRAMFNTLKVRSFCHYDDPVCHGSLRKLLRFGFKYHNNYDQLGEPEEAVKVFFLN